MVLAGCSSSSLGVQPKSLHNRNLVRLGCGFPCLIALTSFLFPPVSSCRGSSQCCWRVLLVLLEFHFLRPSVSQRWWGGFLAVPLAKPILFLPELRTNHCSSPVLSLDGTLCISLWCDFVSSKRFLWTRTCQRILRQIVCPTPRFLFSSNWPILLLRLWAVHVIPTLKFMQPCPQCGLETGLSAICTQWKKSLFHLCWNPT